ICADLSRSLSCSILGICRWSMSKHCSFCDSDAELSLCFLASTVGRRDRLQKCSKGTAACKSCMQELLSRFTDVMPTEILARLRAAYTAICAISTAQSDVPISLPNRRPSRKEAAHG